MSFYKNVEIARKYKVSEPTVTKWIEDSKENKNNLQLKTFNKKLRVLANQHNDAELYRLAQDGVKYKSSANLKKTNPSKIFYSSFSTEEQIEIMNDLRYRSEVNLKFYYKNGGAKMWDSEYKSSGSSIPDITSTLLINSLNDLSDLTSKKNINLIDIGCGNGYPVKPILNKLPFTSYVAVDISEEMMDICKSNILEWKPGILFKSYISDIESSRFGSIFLDNHTLENVNLITFVGATICNTNDRVRILKNFASGMLKDDVLLFTYSLDTVSNRTEFKYVSDSEEDRKRAWVLNSLGFDIDKCKVDIVYDSSEKCKIKYLVLDKDYQIDFNISNHIESVFLRKGHRITRWKHYLLDHVTILEELEKANLNIEFLKVSGNYTLVAAKLKTIS